MSSPRTETSVRRAIAVAATLSLALCVLGCGQKGALYLPDPAPQAVPAAAPAAPAAQAAPAAPATGDEPKPDPAQRKTTAPAEPGH